MGPGGSKMSFLHRGARFGESKISARVYEKMRTWPMRDMTLFLKIQTTVVAQRRT